MYKERKELDYLRLRQELEAGSIRPVYLFCGAEDFLMEEAVLAIARRLLPAGSRDEGFTRLYGPSASLDAALDMVDTVSLFGEKRMVVVKEAPYFAKGSSLEGETAKRLLRHHQDGDSTACLLFCVSEAGQSKVVKDLAAAGAVYRFDQLKSAALIHWLREQFALAGLKPSPDLLKCFAERAGHDLRTLASELEKLATYLGGSRELSEESITAVTTRAAHVDVFALTEAAVYGRTAHALSLLKDILASGEPPLRILAMLVRQFRLLGEAKDLLQNGERDLASGLGIHPYAAEKLAAQVNKTDDNHVARAVELLLQCDLDIKRGRIEPVLALETLVVALGIKSA